MSDLSGLNPTPTQLLCTLRDHCRQGSRNTRYQAGAAPYLGRSSTGWIAPACLAPSFDHLVGAQQDGSGHLDADRLCGLAVDRQLDARRQLNRQIARLFALKNAGDIITDDAKRLEGPRPITDQAAGFDPVSPHVNARHAIADGQGSKLIALVGKETIRANKHAAGSLPGNRCKSLLDLARIARIEYPQT